jgi:hypothetical protein
LPALNQDRESRDEAAQATASGLKCADSHNVRDAAVFARWLDSGGTVLTPANRTKGSTMAESTDCSMDEIETRA